MRGNPRTLLRGRAITWRRLLRRSAPLMLADAALVCLSWLIALMLRYDGEPPQEAVSRLMGFLPFVLALTFLMHGVAGLYLGVLRFASVLEARRILAAQCAVFAVVVPLVWATGRPVPLSVPVIATVLCCGAAGALRFWSRLVRWQRLTGDESERLLVLGAGEAGGALVQAFSTQPTVRVVGLLDDDPGLHGRSVHGARVLGSLADLAEVATRSEASRVVLAIATADPRLVRRLASECGDLGLALSVIPPAAELIGSQVSLQDVRDLEITDLLGRAQIDTDLDEIGQLLRGRRVLITGGGGSIGSELARQVAQFRPSHLVILDHDETHLFDAAAALPGRCVQRLVDIRDGQGLALVFNEERPDVVFHAAALKHVPILESHPVQAVATNVLGTRNVLSCARQAGVQRFVQISTDKAVRPSSVMGSTKLACEHLVLAEGGLTTCAVRFGNVLGSRGSVVPTFIRQIREGGPVTITDGRMTRYFMSIPEAVRLVLHAAALSRGGEIFMLDMGEPVRIHDLATRMIRLSGQRPGADVEVRVTSVRPGEKLDEELHAPEELTHRTSHPSIFRLEPVALPESDLSTAIDAMAAAVHSHDATEARHAIAGLLAARKRRASGLPTQRQASPTDTPFKDEAWT